MTDLDFITDSQLKKTLEDSVEYIYTLYEQSKSLEEKPLYKEETYRVIILYVISAIEAVLMFFFKERDEKITFCEYKYVEILSEKYNHREKSNLPVVIAVQQVTEKKEHQIGLYDLVTFYRDKKLIQEKTAQDILELNDVRNTFHFSKPRVKECDVEKVESALNLLLRTIEKAPVALKIRKEN